MPFGNIGNTKQRILKKNIAVLFLFLLFYILPTHSLLQPQTVRAQACVPWQCVQQGWGGCWSCGGGEVCCECAFGLVPGDHGPLVCANPGCSNPNAPGCGHDTGGGPNPTSTPTTIPSATPTPVTYFYLCTHPGAIVPSDKCESTTIPCGNPDVSGGSCFTTIDRCISGCVIPTGVSITPRNELNILTPCAQRGIFNALDTAIGCFPASDATQMLTFILRWALGLSGGITFLLIVVSAFLIMSSGGNPEKVKAGRELLTAAVAGLVLVIFSVFILDLLGIRVLRIPGL